MLHGETLWYPLPRASTLALPLLLLRLRRVHSKCFLVASYLLEHYHFVRNSPARLRNHICCCHIFLAGSMVSDDLLVLLSNSSAVSRAQGRGARGWFSTSFIFNVLFSA